MYPEIVIHHAAHRFKMLEHPVDEIDLWHRQRGWNGIGYNWVVWQGSSDLWNVQMGRPMNRTGAHTLGYNDAVGVCMADNWSEYEPPVECYEATSKLCAGLLDVLGWFPSVYHPDKLQYTHEPGEAEPVSHLVKGHRELAATECPGLNFDMDRLRDMIYQEMVSHT